MDIRSFFRKRTRTVALIDVGSASVGGAYATIPEDDIPAIWYTAREKVTLREDRFLLSDLERALATLAGRLAREGAAALARSTGSAVIDDIVVSVAAPWEDTRVDARVIERKRTFTFSRALIADTFEKETSRIPAGGVLVDHAVIATLLNGYETNEPFGKRATRADLVVLTTTLDEQVLLAIRAAITRAYNRKEMRIVGFPFVAYTVLRDTYPHERDYLIVDVTGEATDIAMVKRGVLIGVANCECGLNRLLRVAHGDGRATSAAPLEEMRTLVPGDVARQGNDARLAAAKETWRNGFRRVVTDYAARFPLPQTVFLLADAEARGFMQRLITETPLPELRLSDTPFSVIPVTPDQFAPYVHTRGEAQGDEFLAMLALFAGKSAARA